MVTIKERILEYLRLHPEGASDGEIHGALNLANAAQVNMRCRLLQEQGVVVRKGTRPIRNYLAPGDRAEGTDSAAAVAPARVAADPAAGAANGPIPAVSAGRPWCWEGNVVAAIVRYLASAGYHIRRVADTESREHGKDIVAESPSGHLWVSAKGWPSGPPAAQSPAQAAIWFEGAFFDIVTWHGEDPKAQLALGLPDFPRYRALAGRIRWLQPIIGFSYVWVGKDGQVQAEAAPGGGS